MLEILNGTYGQAQFSKYACKFLEAEGVHFRDYREDPIAIALVAQCAACDINAPRGSAMYVRYTPDVAVAYAKYHESDGNERRAIDMNAYLRARIGSIAMCESGTIEEKYVRIIAAHAQCADDLYKEEDEAAEYASLPQVAEKFYNFLHRAKFSECLARIRTVE